MKDHFETCNVLETGRCTCAANASNDIALRQAYAEGYRKGWNDRTEDMRKAFNFWVLIEPGGN